MKHWVKQNLATISLTLARGWKFELEETACSQRQVRWEGDNVPEMKWLEWSLHKKTSGHTQRKHEQAPVQNVFRKMPHRTQLRRRLQNLKRYSKLKDTDVFSHQMPQSNVFKHFPSGVHLASDCQLTRDMRIYALQIMWIALFRHRMKTGAEKLLPWPKKLRQARKPNIGAYMLDRSRACAMCARWSQFFWPG